MVAIAGTALPGCGVATVAGATAGAAAAATSAASTPLGPHVVFINDSETPFHVRYWVGRVDAREPGGVADWRTDAHVTVPPGEKSRCNVGRRGWLTPNADAVVRLEVTSDAGEKFWFQLDGAAPYHVRASEDEEHWRFEALGGDLLDLVPQEEQFAGRLGPHPVR
jgi:hypothetical protein